MKQPTTGSVLSHALPELISCEPVLPQPLTEAMLVMEDKLGHSDSHLCPTIVGWCHVLTKSMKLISEHSVSYLIPGIILSSHTAVRVILMSYIIGGKEKIHLIQLSDLSFIQ